MQSHNSPNPNHATVNDALTDLDLHSPSKVYEEERQRKGLRSEQKLIRNQRDMSMHDQQLSSSLNLDTQVAKPACTNEELTVMSSEKSDGGARKKGRPSEISEQDCEGNLLMELHQQN